MTDRPIDAILLDGVALAFPPGGISELTRKFNGSYRQSFEAYKDDPRIRQRDFRTLVGHTRRALINTNMVEFAEQYPNLVTCSEKMEGVDGDNNHVELRVGNFLVTHHHHTKSDRMPEDFINLSSAYNVTNAEINEYVAPEWFADKKVMKHGSEGLLNLLILHEKSSEGLHEIGNVEFVFPRKSKKFVVLKIGDLTRKQAEIMEMDPEDLFDFKRRTADEIRRLVA